MLPSLKIQNGTQIQDERQEIFQNCMLSKKNKAKIVYY
jgi:hypothetical protein